MAGFGPDWWHNNGGKMAVATCHLDTRSLLIQGTAALLRATCESVDKGSWLIEWEIKMSHEGFVRGQLVFTTEEFGHAFGLEEFDSHKTKFGEHLRSRFRADVCEQGKYIRKRNFLNIPGPGTGYDGDPNISFDIDLEIKGAVRLLIGLVKKHTPVASAVATQAVPVQVEV